MGGGGAGKGGGRGKKFNKTRRGGPSGYGNASEVEARNRGEDGEEVEEGSSSEEEEEEEDTGDKLGQVKEELSEEEKKRAAEQAAEDAELAKELEERFNLKGLTKKQRQELEDQKEQREREAAFKKGDGSGSAEQVAADKARLEEVRKRREEAAKLRAEKEAQALASKAEEADTKSSAAAQQDDVAKAVAGLLAKKGPLTLNQLNQDPEAKKVLKPLLKKANVKALNRAFLEKFTTHYKLVEEGGIVTLSPK